MATPPGVSAIKKNERRIILNKEKELETIVDQYLSLLDEIIILEIMMEWSMFCPKNSLKGIGCCPKLCERYLSLIKKEEELLIKMTAVCIDEFFLFF